MARAIFDSVRTRRADVVVPGVFAPFVPLYAVMPRAALRRVVRLLGPDRVVKGDAPRARVAYERAVLAQGGAS